uniref:Uncharacterized protein n=2 Tax=Rhizophora mucronata TaxID=61149 RepID=A0A2P2LNN3_RHIMU
MQQYECATDSNSKLHDQGNFLLYKVERKPDKKPSKREPNQSTAVVASDLQNHQDPSTNSVHQDWCLKEANATSNDETSHSIPSSFENPTFILGECTPPTVIPSDFELQLPHMEGGCLLTSNFEKQMTTYREGEYHPTVTPNSNQTPCGKGDWILDLDIQNQISPHVKGDSLLISGSKDQISVGGDSKHSPVISYDFRSKLPYDIGDCLLTSDLEDPMSDIDFKCLLTSLPSPSFDSEDKSTYEKDSCLKTSDLENPISDIEFEEREQNYLIPRPSCLEDLSTLYEGEPNSLSAYDFKKISSNEKANISVSGEGDSSFLKATPSDFANQNQFQKTDMQNPDVDCDLLEDVDVESVLKMLDPMENPAAEHNAPSTPNLGSPS